MRLPLLLAALALATACSRGEESAAEGRRRLLSAEGGGGAAAPDLSRPLEALAMDGDEAAQRLGSFEWTASIEWSVAREGEDATRVRAVERHRVRQSASGDFDVLAEVDPGLGPGSETGREVIFAGGATYGRARHAPWRERPTDRGRDARRFREESLGVARALAGLAGEALAVTPAGDARALGRAARRYALSLAPGAAAPTPSPRPAAAQAPDDDTGARLRFLDGRVPTAASGELLLDAETGVPLRVRLSAAFAVKEAPGVRATVELLAQVRALGGEVAAIAPPKGALPDERKAAGVAGALEAAGLRKRGADAPARAEPVDEAVE